MLVITRRVDEAVQIGHEISVRIVEVDGTKIRLGIDAPGDISVRRIELESCDESIVAVECQRQLDISGLTQTKTPRPAS